MRSFGTVMLAALVAVLVFADISQAQRGGRGRGRGMFGAGGGMMRLLQNEQVREELQLVDDQMEEFEELQQELQDEMRSMFEGMRDLDRDERRQFFEDVRGKMEEKTKEYEKRMNEILLPHQVKRLKQIEMQMGNRGGIANNSRLIEELGLEEGDVEKLKEKAAEVQKKLDEKIRKLRQQATDEIISVLSSEQQKKFKELMGEQFNMTQRRGGPGGPGGRGGRDRGGRGRDRSDF